MVQNSEIKRSKKIILVDLSERDLIIGSQKNNKESEKYKEELLKRYEGLIVQWTNKYFKILNVQGMEFDDLLIDAKLGFLKALEKFDINKGNALSTYATHCMRNYILNSIRVNNNMIKLSSREVNKRIKLSKKFKENMLNKSNYKFNYNIYNKIFSQHNVRLIDTHEYQSYLDNSSIEQEISSEEMFMEKEQKRFNTCQIISALKILDKTELFIIVHYFGLFNKKKRTLRELSKRLDIGYENTRKIKGKALSKIECYFKKNNIKIEDFKNIF